MSSNLALRRSRTTADARVTVKMAAQEAEVHPAVIFDAYANRDTEKLVESADFSILPPFQGKPLSDSLDDLHEAFAKDRLQELHEEAIIASFKTYVHSIITPEIRDEMVAFWPPVVPTDEPRTLALILWLIRFVHEADNPNLVVRWIGREMASEAIPSARNSQLKAFGLARLHGGKAKKKGEAVAWAELDRRNEFVLIGINEQRLVPGKRVIATGVRNDSKGNVEIMKDDKVAARFVPVDEKKSEVWNDCVNKEKPFPLFFGSVARPIPGEFIVSFYEALTANDFMLPNVLSMFEVTKIVDGVPVMEALLNVFAHAGKVNQLLQVIVGTEVGRDQVTNNTIMRNNSNLTNMFKVFYARYGKEYYFKVIKKAIKFVDKQEINWKSLVQASVSRALVIVLTVIKHFLDSGPAVSPQMRHMASVLRALVTARFNDKQATFNALSGFFLLRYANRLMMEHKDMDPDFVTNHEPDQVFLPFSQILQYLFNLMPFHGKLTILNVWNKRVIREVFPKMTDFVLSLGDYENDAVYEVPSEAQLTQSLEIIITQISKSKGAFETKYRKLLEEKHQYSVPGWSLSTFLMSFFQENENRNIHQVAPDE